VGGCGFSKAAINYFHVFFFKLTKAQHANFLGKSLKLEKTTVFGSWSKT
jgi:hypothetical protein